MKQPRRPGYQPHEHTNHPHAPRDTHAQHTPQKTASGIIEITRKATGFVAWDGGEDIEIQTQDLGGALGGDEVEVVITGMALPRHVRGADRFKAPMRPQGRVTRVVARARTQFVATLKHEDGKWLALPDDGRFYRPININQSDSFAFEEGVKVLVKLISFIGGQDPEGEVTEIIGRAGEHRVEQNAIVLEHGFSTSFPAEVERESRALAERHAQIIADEATRRADYRSTTTFTIDPVDAKDFDDALSVRALGNGEWEVGVHIADASFFVREGTALDEEAVRRGTSVYLVDATIPMLPHALSNDICSLRANEDRLAFSAVFRINARAEILERRFERGIIRSDKRFTYEEAQEVLDQNAGLHLAELTVLRDLARIMRRGREEQGAIDFGDNEVRFTLDEQGFPVSVVRKVRIETQLMIEEWMLLANREVAQHVSDLARKVPEKNLVFLYRIHDEPKEDRIEDLATFVRALGYDFGRIAKGGTAKKYSARDIRKLLRDIEGTPEEALIRTATLRSMAKAIYTTKNIGHFGLAFEHYTHFTSPIRRYPDILVHRILASHLEGQPISRNEYGHLEKLCIQASLREAQAVSAERDSIRYKQIEYLSARVGRVFEGTITGVTNWGIYVADNESGAEGLVRAAAIGGDFFEHRPKEYSLVGQRTKKKLTLGDRVRAKVVSANLAARTVDLELVVSR